STAPAPARQGPRSQDGRCSRRSDHQRPVKKKVPMPLTHRPWLTAVWSLTRRSRAAGARRKHPQRRLFLEVLEDRTLPATSLLAAAAGAQLMPSVAVDPLDSNHVVAAYMDYSLTQTGYAGIGVAVSHDGGASWQR